MSDFSVIIGGAGYSGISASNILHDNDVSFVILEATERVGGRMWQQQFGVPGKEYTIENGAQWIDGIEGNPAWAQAEQEQLNGVFMPFTTSVYDENGDYNEFETNWRRGSYAQKKSRSGSTAEALVDQCIQLEAWEFPISSSQQRRCNSLHNPFEQGDEGDRSATEVYTAAGWDPSQETNPALARIYDCFVDDFGSGEENEITSTMHGFHSVVYDDFSSGDLHVLDPRGFSWLPRSQAASFLVTSGDTSTLEFNDDRLKNNVKVLLVEWDPSGERDVNVVACNTTKLEQENMPILYPCAGDLFNITGEHFLSTFSLGVLQKCLELEEAGESVEQSYDISPRFDPPLSSIDGGLFMESLSKNALGLYTKCWFQFDFRFWDQMGTDFFLSAHSEDGYEGNFAPIWFSYDHGDGDVDYYPGSNIIMLYTMGDRARALSNQTDAESKSALLGVLNNMFQDAIWQELGRSLVVNDIKAFHKTRWSLDPLYYGGWSNWRLGFTNDDHARISKRYGNLVFSGEHTCRRHHGYTHGAKMAGERSALVLVQERYGKDVHTRTLCDFDPWQL